MANGDASVHPTGAAPAVLPTAQCGRYGTRLGARPYALEVRAVLAGAAAVLSAPERSWWRPRRGEPNAPSQ
jgi:hypothetical protein